MADDLDSLNRELKQCQKDVNRLQEELTECEMEKLRKQNRALSQRMQAIETGRPVRSRSNSFNEMFGISAAGPAGPSMPISRIEPENTARKIAKAEAQRQLAQAKLQQQRVEQESLARNRPLRDADLDVMFPSGAASEAERAQALALERAQALAREKAQALARKRQQTPRDSAARLRADAAQQRADDNRRRGTFKPNVSRKLFQDNVSAFTSSKSAEDIEDEERKRKLQQIQQERNRRAEYAKRERARLDAKRAEREQIRNLPPVELPGKDGWWQEMFEGEKTDRSSATEFSLPIGPTGKKYRQLPRRDWDALYREKSRREKRKNNFAPGLRF